MNNKIIVDFGNIISEMKNKEFKIVFLKDRCICIEDVKGNMYQIDIYYVGSYLDKIVKNGLEIEFNLIDSELIKNIKEYEKEVWGVEDIESFIERHHSIMSK
jgi:hypothetical protein